MMKRRITVWAVLIILPAAISILWYGYRFAGIGNTDPTPGFAGSGISIDAPEPARALDADEVRGEDNSSPEPGVSAPLIPCLYFDEASFTNAVASAIIFDEDITGLKGGIVPHHLLAGGMIASFWKTVSQSSYDLIVIIGPDHNRKGQSEITTITSGFSTIYGDVASIKNIANDLIQGNFVLEDPKTMETDHSISSHIPFISYYMPDTPVLPLLVNGNCNARKIRELSDNILKTTKDIEVLFVASMDFSHYLPLEEANEKDRYTEQVLASFDYDRIMEMTNDHLDSRPSALYLLYTMSTAGSKSVTKWAHSNSDIISNTVTGYTTSYFSFGFFEESERQPEGNNNTSDKGDRNHNTTDKEEFSNNAVTDRKEYMQNETGKEEFSNDSATDRKEYIQNETGKESNTRNKTDEKEMLHIIATGDIMLGRGVSSNIKDRNLDFIYPFTEVKSILDDGDIVFGNLEQPITESTECLNADFKYILKSGTEAISGLSFAGFDILSLANNHIMDYYETGLSDTLSVLENNNIASVGAGCDLYNARKPAIIEKNGIRVGFLAYTDMADIVHIGNPSIKFAAEQVKAGVAPLNPALIEEDICMLRDKVDILAVSLHWGIEDSYNVTEEQIELAHKICDFGADIILGHHPHRFQGIEIYQSKPIIYSLGNFIFDQVPENQESLLLCLAYEDSVLSGIRAIPIRTENQSIVVPQKGLKAKGILERVIHLSKELGTEFTVENDSLLWN